MAGSGRNHAGNRLTAERYVLSKKERRAPCSIPTSSTKSW